MIQFFVFLIFFFCKRIVKKEKFFIKYSTMKFLFWIILILLWIVIIILWKDMLKVGWIDYWIRLILNGISYDNIFEFQFNIEEKEKKKNFVKEFSL